MIGVTTVEFGYQGANYTIELCRAHTDGFHRLMQSYASRARVEATARRRRTGDHADRGPAHRPRSEARAGANLAAIPRPARDNGHQVSDRGRIPREIRQAYAAAH